ncbi:hypothetical protein C5167_034090 [Papaver somniferum]|uniref:Uncharacterized protein n=1 Tax=Papaver somniferum TaxID=3469 RepID=A0A4Y7KFE5_PAPSO|nr:hypothetical protein C5167_034090 [Papaver somniferum]
MQINCRGAIAKGHVFTLEIEVQKIVRSTASDLIIHERGGVSPTVADKSANGIFPHSKDVAETGISVKRHGT